MHQPLDRPPQAHRLATKVDKYVEQSNGCELRLNTSSPWHFRLAMLFFLLFGSLGLLATLAVLVQGEPISLFNLLMGTLIGAMFVAVGTLAFETSGIVINKRTDEFIEWSCFLGKRRVTAYPLQSLQGFAMIRSWNTSRVGSPKLFRVVAEHHAGAEKDIEIIRLGAAAFTFAIARRLARFADLPLHVIDQAPRTDRSMSRSLPHD